MGGRLVAFVVCGLYDCFVQIGLKFIFSAGEKIGFGSNMHCFLYCKERCKRDYISAHGNAMGIGNVHDKIAP